MKRLSTVILSALVFAALACPGAAFADSLEGSKGWTVTFNDQAKMVDNYSTKQWADDINQLQPGDDITFKVTLKHEHKTACDWYMANEVIKTLEENQAEGSAYGYYLTYTNPAGQKRVLYNSESVGGDTPNKDGDQGLLEATSALQEFFYLDNLKQGQTAHVDLKVTLDGETEGNAYFDTLAQLKMKFAVELPTSSTTTSTPNRPNDRNVVQTGDDTNLLPFYIAMTVSGAVLLVIAIASLRSRRKDKRGAHTS